MDDRTLLEDYAILKSVIADATEKLEAMQPEVVAAIVRLNPSDKTVVADRIGTFTVAARKSYVYPADIEAADAALRERKKDAVRLGTATVEEKEYLVFRPEGSSPREA